jgi:hypothetical protein
MLSVLATKHDLTQTVWLSLAPTQAGLGMMQKPNLLVICLQALGGLAHGKSPRHAWQLPQRVWPYAHVMHRASLCVARSAVATEAMRLRCAYTFLDFAPLVLECIATLSLLT